MSPSECKQLVAETGRILLNKGLVARTWGNISARVDDASFAISPSGLGYEHMTPQDVPIYRMKDGTWEGERKPSSEKKIHAAAYAAFADVNFVIHTHQDYATAVGLVCDKNGLLPCDLRLTEEERQILGEVRAAGYGLPGTKTLKKHVAEMFQCGCRVVLMKHHGAIVLGKDREEAFLKAETLEKVCKRLVEDTVNNGSRDTESVKASSLSPLIETVFPGAVIIRDANILEAAKDGGFRCQLDDLAQMIGPKLPAVKSNADVIRALRKLPAVLVKDMGCVIHADCTDNADALQMLVKKAAMTYVFTKRMGTAPALSYFDCALMQQVFKRKYARKKNG